jgi:glycosyltransferase involved in cell wall biosynthesis
MSAGVMVASLRDSQLRIQVGVMSLCLSNFREKKVLLVSHDLLITGAPLLLIETAMALLKAAVDVRLTNIGFRDPDFPLPRELDEKLVPAEDSFQWAASADLIIVNTVVCKRWLQKFLEGNASAGKKVIWWIHEIDIEKFGADMSCLSACSAAIFDSVACCQEWQKTGYRMPEIATVVYPSLTSDFLRKADHLRQLRTSNFTAFLPWLGASRECVRRKLGIAPEHVLVSLFGTYGAYKGHDLLLQTLASAADEAWAKNLRLLLIGLPSTRMRFSLFRKLSAAERKVIGLRCFLNRVADLKPYYLASDVFVLNTQHPGETFGRVTIEAMAFHLPVLGTDAGGTREIIEEGVNGLLHPLGREGQTVLRENLKMLVENPRTLKAMGESAYARVCEKFTEERFHRELAQLMGNVYSKNANSSNQLSPFQGEALQG